MGNGVCACVQEPDGSCSMVAHMGVLVDSMVATLRDSDRGKGASSSAGGATTTTARNG